MSKCIKGIPFYNDKVKDAAQQFAINKGLDEADKPFNKTTTVQATTPDKSELFRDIAIKQRGTGPNDPEHIMLKYQQYAGGGSMSHQMEHLGDLLWRTTHAMPARHYGIDSKINGGISWLNITGPEFHVGGEILKTDTTPDPRRAYADFLRNLESNIKAIKKEGLTPPTLKGAKKIIKEYGEAHAELPVYNKVQWIMREVPIALSKFDYIKVKALLEILRDYPRDTFWKDFESITTDKKGRVLQYKPPKGSTISKDTPNLAENIRYGEEYYRKIIKPTRIKSEEPVIKQLMPTINQAMSQVTREMGLPLPKEVGNTTAEQRKKDPGIYASMSKDKLSFDVPNINIKYGNELKKTLALAEHNTNKINRYLAGEKMTKPGYNLFAGLYSTKELQILAHLYHEMGHHLVNYYKNPYKKVSTLKKIIKDIKPEQDAPKTRSTRASKNADEWFAENFSYWAMNKYQGESPIGPPRTVLDARFMQLIRQILDKSL